MPCAKFAICSGLVFAALIGATGCEVSRPSSFEGACSDYDTSIRPVIMRDCGTCHDSANRAGGYLVGNYLDTVSRRDDGTPRVDPGTEDTAFLLAARGDLAAHQAVSASDYTVLRRWVVGCRAAPKGYQNHPRGWGTPTDHEQFHGAALRDAGYAFSACTECHGNDLRGGRSGADCSECHTGADGPRSCNTCHGDETSAAPPRAIDASRTTSSRGVGAHRRHVLESDTHLAFGCTTCHAPVNKVYDEGHYRRNGVFTLGPAAVVFSGDLADAGASWSAASLTCSNTCHSPNQLDTAAVNPKPRWVDESAGRVACNSCHGNPPSTHFQAQCEVCHGAGYADGGVDRALHVNGRVDLTGATAGCSSCHAGPASPAFFDLNHRGADAGSTTASLHDAHSKASTFRGPMGCGECHLVPTVVTSPGHIDSALPAEVFPTGVMATSLAFRDGAQARYEPQAATCTAYCHGAGASMPLDAGTVQRTPRWAATGTRTLGCGTACHALPPDDGTYGHSAAVTASQRCSSCHGGTVTDDGGIRFFDLPDGGRATTHIDGRVTGER